MSRSPRIPSYRLHKASGQAVVVLDGRSFYLGKYGTEASRTEYQRLVEEWLASRRRPTPTGSTAPSAPALGGRRVTVEELIWHYWRHVKSYYVKAGKPTSEQGAIRCALRFVRRLHGHIPAEEFGPLSLLAVREAMIRHRVTREVKVTDPDTGERRLEVRVIREGLSRRSINKQVGRIKRMFAWGVEKELIPAYVHAALLRVAGLRRGKSAAPESPRIKPVAQGHVEAVLPHLREVVRVMVQVQQLCGCRPHEVTEMRGDDIRTDLPVWEYRPTRYKTEHHNDESDPDLERVIFLGPRAQVLLKPFLDACGGGFLFSPAHSHHTRPGVIMSHKDVGLCWAAEPKQAAEAKAALRDHYAVGIYRQAIRRGCIRAGVPVWRPNQLRHGRLTEVRRRFGLEASKACGGHREIGVTQHYAEQDQELARRVIGEIG
jgi:integrase